jgi:hypothetical protein
MPIRPGIVRKRKPHTDVIEVRLSVRVGKLLAGGRYSSNKLSEIWLAT